MTLIIMKQPLYGLDIFWASVLANLPSFGEPCSTTWNLFCDPNYSENCKVRNTVWDQFSDLNYSDTYMVRKNLWTFGESYALISSLILPI